MSAARRPIRAREARWAAATASWLTRVGVRPNQISLLSVAFAGLAGACLVIGASADLAIHVLLFLLAAACIQLRLICNLLDGMVAVEGGQRTRSGEIFNDLPDRIADPVILVAAGYSAPWVGWVPDLGWAAAVLAILTAYVRVLGAASGLPQDFVGPMAKQHRMAVMTVAALVGAIEPALGWSGQTMAVALGVIAVGSAITVVRRGVRVVRSLESQQGPL